MTSEHAPLGVLEEQVIVAVVRTANEPFGMHVRRELERVTGRSIAIGAVYATLDRLEAKGLLSSHRASGAGPSRRAFALTPAGARALTDTQAMRARLWQGVDLARLAAMAAT